MKSKGRIFLDRKRNFPKRFLLLSKKVKVIFTGDKSLYTILPRDYDYVSVPSQRSSKIISYFLRPEVILALYPYVNSYIGRRSDYFIVSRVSK